MNVLYENRAVYKKTRKKYGRSRQATQDNKILNGKKFPFMKVNCGNTTDKFA